MNYLKRSFKITSASNPLIKETVRIKKRLDKKSSLLLAEGLHLAEAAAHSSLASAINVFITDDFAAAGENTKILDGLAVEKVFIVSDKILSVIADTESPQGIVAILDYKIIKPEQLRLTHVPLLVVCDAVRDPGNLGTIIRAADAFGADGVIVLPFSCDPFNPKAVRSSAGSLFSIPIVRAGQNELFNYLALKNIALYAAVPYAQDSIYQINMKKPVAIAFGNEAEGVSSTLLKKASGSFRIPIVGRAESLNVAMSASVCLYEVMRQRESHHITKGM
jgi:TrmH family RNA methyltransferase